MQIMSKVIKFVLIIYIMLGVSANAKMYKVGEKINNGVFEITKDFKINLST